MSTIKFVQTAGVSHQVDPITVGWIAGTVNSLLNKTGFDFYVFTNSAENGKIDCHAHGYDINNPTAEVNEAGITVRSKGTFETALPDKVWCKIDDYRGSGEHDETGKELELVATILFPSEY